VVQHHSLTLWQLSRCDNWPKTEGRNPFRVENLGNTVTPGSAFCATGGCMAKSRWDWNGGNGAPDHAAESADASRPQRGRAPKPKVASSELPWESPVTTSTPSGVAPVLRNPFRVENLCNTVTPGSAFCATRGCMAKSRWDLERRLPDPNGVAPQSPRLRGTSHLGRDALSRHQPQAGLRPFCACSGRRSLRDTPAHPPRRARNSFRRDVQRRAGALIISELVSGAGGPAG
jgi:putative hemolysin